MNKWNLDELLYVARIDGFCRLFRCISYDFNIINMRQIYLIQLIINSSKYAVSSKFLCVVARIFFKIAYLKKQIF